MIEIQTTLTLRCDRCKGTFLYVAEVDATGIANATDADGMLAAARLRIQNTSDQLRDLAQQGEWAHVLPVPSGQPELDLCGRCSDPPILLAL